LGEKTLIVAWNRPPEVVPIFYFGAAGAAGAGVAGAAGITGAGTAGAVCFDVFENCCNTERAVDAAMVFWCIVKAIDVSMNIMAHQVVAFVRNVAAPRGPNAVWLPAPPNAPARSAASPLCKSTTIIKTPQIITCKEMSIK